MDDADLQDALQVLPGGGQIVEATGGQAEPELGPDIWRRREQRTLV